MKPPTKPAGITVSVVVPTYNRAGTIGACIDGILGQSSPADQVIVVDDGSSDGTATVLAGRAGRIEVLRQDNAGVSAARNAGIARATSEWIAFLDSDDLWMPDRLAILRRDLAEAPPEVGVHVADLRFTGPGYDSRLFDLRGRSFPHGRAERLDDALPLALAGLSCQSLAARRSWIEAAGGFDVGMHIYEDMALFSQLALMGPWLFTGDLAAEVRRIPGDAVALSRLERSRQREATEHRVRRLEALLERPMSPAQRRLTRLHASAVLMKLARIHAEAGLGDVRGLLLRAARRHPSPWRGWAKSLPPLLLGTRGFAAIRSPVRSFSRS